MALPRKAFERAVIVTKDNFKHQDYSLNQPVYVGRQLNEIKDDLAFHNLENAKSNYTKKKKPKESNGNDYFDVFYSDYSHQKKEHNKDNSNDYFDVHLMGRKLIVPDDEGMVRNSDHQLKKKKPPKNNYSNDYFDVYYSDYQLKKKKQKNRNKEFGKDYEGRGKNLNYFLQLVTFKLNLYNLHPTTHQLLCFCIQNKKFKRRVILNL